MHVLYVDKSEQLLGMNLVPKRTSLPEIPIPKSAAEIYNIRSTERKAVMTRTVLGRQVVTVILSLMIAFAFMPTLTQDVFGAVKKPGTPKITSIQTSGNTVTMKWSKVRSAKSYRVYQVTGTTWKYWKKVTKSQKSKYSNKKKYKLKKSGSKYKIYKKTYKYACLKKGLTARSYQFTGEYSTYYRFAVRAYNGTKAGSFSAVNIVRTADKPSSTPAAITGLRATAITDSTISITWNKLSSNVTGYEIRVNGDYYCEVGSNTNTLTVNNLSSETTYKLKVRAYYKPTATTANYGTPAEITVTTTQEGTSGGSDPGDSPGTDNPGTDNPGTNANFDYHSVPYYPNTLTIGDGTKICSYGNAKPQIRALTDAWMADNLPSDATDAEKVNLCKKCMHELIHTPESKAILGSNPSNYACNTYALYFDTCCASAGIVSASRSCKYDENYDVPFLSTHSNNFVWVNGTGYIVNVNAGTTAKPTLYLMDYDWQNWHAVPTNTTFTCRYY